jgi:5'-nucleotidase
MLFFETPPDLVISGINRGSNAGRAVLYSGTLGGAIEGAFKGIPGIGFSSVNEQQPKYDKFITYIKPIIEHFFSDPLPEGTVLNVNFPDTSEPRGIKMARQGSGSWLDEYEEVHVEKGRRHILLKGGWQENGWHEESDYLLLKQGFITVVPIHVYEMTCQKSLNSRKVNFEKALGVHF